MEKKIRERTISCINKYVKNNKLTKEIENEVMNYSSKYALERGIENNFKKNFYINLYQSKARSLIINLNPSTINVLNETLLKNVKSGTISPEELVNLSPAELHPEKWNIYIKRQEILDKEVIETTEHATTDQFKCPRCKLRKCTYVSAQTRSADEGMTNFITCVECGHSWRQ